MIPDPIVGIGMTSRRTRDRMIERLFDQGISDMAVMDAVRTIPRHIFVDEALSHRAYEDSSLPIGYSQTLSQPYIVARMTELLVRGGPLNKVLEIGTGSGYQTAILSLLAGKVYTLERIKPLQDKARQRFRTLGLRNIYHKHTDGTGGWPEKGPFDGIIATAAPRGIPQGLVDQLAVGGRLVMPVGDREQVLHVVTRQGEGDAIDVTVVETVHFVPLLGGTVQ